jgi:methyltransferase (TIGR00027 family)
MRQGWSSFTAALVTLGRAIGTQDAVLRGSCRDPIAQSLLPEPLAAAASFLPLLPAPVLGAVRRASLGLFDHIALRTGMIDAALEAALRAGPRQVVILGAGFDTRAYRLACLGECLVYEVDHPATQAQKRARSAALPLSAAGLRHVPCDFHDSELSTVLRDAGFDPARPSVWIWEGVTVYLREQAVRGTLASIAQLSAADTTLISTYVRPDVVHGGALWARLGAMVLFTAAEPVHFVASAESYRVLLAAHGFERVSDQTTAAHAAQVGVRLPALRMGMPVESICVARRS